MKYEYDPKMWFFAILAFDLDLKRQPGQWWTRSAFVSCRKFFAKCTHRGEKRTLPRLFTCGSPSRQHGIPATRNSVQTPHGSLRKRHTNRGTVRPTDRTSFPLSPLRWTSPRLPLRAIAMHPHSLSPTKLLLVTAAGLLCLGLAPAAEVKDPVQVRGENELIYLRLEPECPTGELATKLMRTMIIKYQL